MFGKAMEMLQSETTPFHPRSLYGCAKVYSFWQTVNYRESYGLFCCSSWGFAGDCVEAMWLMLQQDVPDDYVISSGQTHSVREFLELAFDRVKLDWKWFVEIDQRYFRPAEVHMLLGDALKAKRVLGWEPKVTFERLTLL
jgi:GDPmannose 4,6-dehydratase